MGNTTGKLRINFWQMQRFFSKASRPTLGPKIPATARVPGALSPKIMWPGHEADLSNLVPS